MHNGMKQFRILILLLAALFLAGCANSDQNPLKKYEHMSSQQIFDGGVKALKKHNYNTAAKHFEALDALYPFGKYSERAQYYIIYAYYANDDTAMALAAAGRYIRLYPRSKHVAYAYYMRGVINMGRKYNWFQKAFGADRASRDITYLRQAFVDFSQVVRLFPKSQYAPDAHKRMLIIRNILAQHELEVAVFYYKRKAYIGAANRANFLVTHYPGAPQVVPALALMVKCYSEVGETDLSIKAAKVLTLNYPKSRQAKEVASFMKS